MIISASRRTDIPAFYSEWFLNRLDAGYVMVRHPFNYNQVSMVGLSPDVVDAIVFWTKNSEPMISQLDKLAPYAYYFQFTLNPYDRVIEPSLPALSRRVAAFKRLSDCIGPERVIWRYDPILLSEEIDVAYHVEQFGKLAAELQGYTRQCIISFYDVYSRNVKLLAELGIHRPSREQIVEIAEAFSEVAHKHGFGLATCAESIDLGQFGIGHASCIDAGLIEKMLGVKLDVPKDKNQRQACGCYASIDIGLYNTCRHGCIYCYAVYGEQSAGKNASAYDPLSPLLCSRLTGKERIVEKECKSHKVIQPSFFD